MDFAVKGSALINLSVGWTCQLRGQLLLISMCWMDLAVKGPALINLCVGWTCQLRGQLLLISLLDGLGS